MSQQIKQTTDDLRRLIGGTSKKNKRVVFIGTRKAAKTTSLGCLALACEVMHHRNPKFTFYIDEKSSGICQVPSDLRLGKFPDQTISGFIYEADVHLKLKSTLGTQQLILPFIETAGEDMQNLAGPYTRSVYTKSADYEREEVIEQYVGDSNGFVGILPTPRARMFEGGTGIEDEDPNMNENPDLNMKRILQSIFNWKDDHPESPRIEGIAMLLTKYDKIQKDCERRNMDLFKPEQRNAFLTTYFSQTKSLLDWYGIEKVRFFPTFVQVERTKMPDGTLVETKRADGKGPQIAVNLKRNLPIFSEQSYYDLIDWLLKVFR